MSLFARFWRWLTGHTTPLKPPPPKTGGKLIRVTTPNDGTFVNRMYSYWSSAFVSNGIATVFVGHIDGHPRFFRVELANGQVTPLGALLPYTGTAEGWYFSRDGWIYMCDGPRLRRVHPLHGGDEVVVDISESHPGCDLWQADSSEDGRVHSATVRQITLEGAYPALGTLISRDGQQQFIPAIDALDESAVDASGEFVLIKEGADDDNRIITLETGEERRISKADGALGHSDMGSGFAVGADRAHGLCVKLDLRTLASKEIFKTWSLGHVSVRAGKILVSDEAWLTLIQSFDEGGGLMTSLVQHGMVGNDYDHQVFANLDPSGQVACFMSNMGTDRFDAYLYVLGN